MTTLGEKIEMIFDAKQDFHFGSFLGEKYHKIGGLPVTTIYMEIGNGNYGVIR